jgi:hypothetical protein
VSLLGEEGAAQWERWNVRHMNPMIARAFGRNLNREAVAIFRSWPLVKRLARAANTGVNGIVCEPFIRTPEPVGPHFPASAELVKCIVIGGYPIYRNFQEKFRFVSDILNKLDKDGEPYIRQACIRCFFQGNFQEAIGLSYESMASQIVFVDLLPLAPWIQKQISGFVCDGGSDIISTEIRMEKYARIFDETLRSAEFASEGLSFDEYVYGVLKILVTFCASCKVHFNGPLWFVKFTSTDCTCDIYMYDIKCVCTGVDIACDVLVTSLHCDAVQ